MSQARGLDGVQDTEPRELIGHGAFAILFSEQGMNRPYSEPQGVGTAQAVATELPTNWTQVRYRDASGAERCQGGTR